MRTAVTAAAAVALVATTASEASSNSVSLPISLPLNSLETRGGARFPDNDKAPPRRTNKKKRRSPNNTKKNPHKEKPNEDEKETQEANAQEAEAPEPPAPSPQETLINELLSCDDYYTILGVPKTATATQIQKAYRKRAVQTHPDKVPNNDRRAFDKVAEAYDVLSDETKRATYNRFGKRGLDPTTAEGRPPSSFTEDLFKNFFSSQYRSPFQQQPRNQNVRYQLEVTLEELYTGLDKHVIVTDPGRKKVHVSIEKGMHSGQAIVLSGEMDHVQDATPADLVFVLQQRPHPHFTRKGHDLAMELNISLQEAVCGMTRTIRHLDGRLVSISSAKDANDVNMLIQTGDVQVLKGEGMPKPGERRDAHGDLYVQYKVEMPTQEAVDTLTNDERQQLGQLLGKLEGDSYYQRRNNANDNTRSVQTLQKASPGDFGRVSGPFRVETEDYADDRGKRGFPFGAGQRHFHFSSGSSFFGGAFGGGARQHDEDFDDGDDVQCRQM